MRFSRPQNSIPPLQSTVTCVTGLQDNTPSLLSTVVLFIRPQDSIPPLQSTVMRVLRLQLQANIPALQSTVRPVPRPRDKLQSIVAVDRHACHETPTRCRVSLPWPLLSPQHCVFTIVRHTCTVTPQKKGRLCR